MLSLCYALAIAIATAIVRAPAIVIVVAVSAMTTQFIIQFILLSTRAISKVQFFQKNKIPKNPKRPTTAESTLGLKPEIRIEC